MASLPQSYAGGYTITFQSVPDIGTLTNISKKIVELIGEDGLHSASTTDSAIVSTQLANKYVLPITTWFGMKQKSIDVPDQLLIDLQEKKKIEEFRSYLRDELHALSAFPAAKNSAGGGRRKSKTAKKSKSKSKSRKASKKSKKSSKKSKKSAKKSKSSKKH